MILKVSSDLVDWGGPQSTQSRLGVRQSTQSQIGWADWGGVPQSTPILEIGGGTPIPICSDWGVPQSQFPILWGGVPPNLSNLVTFDGEVQF